MLVLALEFSRDGCSATPRTELRHRQPQKPSRRAAGTTARPGHARGERSAYRGGPGTTQSKRGHEELPKGSVLVTRSAHARHDAEGDVTGEGPH
jgi:hypothetical protein